MNNLCILCHGKRECCHRCGFVDDLCSSCSIDLRSICNRVVCSKCWEKYRCSIPRCSELTVRICRDCRTPAIDCKVCYFHHPYESLCDECITNRYTCQMCKKITSTWVHDCGTFCANCVEKIVLAPFIYRCKECITSYELWEKYKICAVTDNHVDHTNENLTDDDMRKICSILDLKQPVSFTYHKL
jgi:hypothetical protein